MTKTALTKLIREAVQEFLKESVNYDHLTDDISSSSEIGKSYVNAVYSLGYLLNEIETFNSSFASALKGQKLNTATYVQNLHEVMKILEGLHKPVKVMSEIERRDSY